MTARSLNRLPWYREMRAADDTALYEALSKETMKMEDRLIAAGWDPREAERLARQAVDTLTAGRRGWQKITVLRELWG